MQPAGALKAEPFRLLISPTWWLIYSSRSNASQNLTYRCPYNRQLPSESARNKGARRSPNLPEAETSSYLTRPPPLPNPHLGARRSNKSMEVERPPPSPGAKDKTYFLPFVQDKNKTAPPLRRNTLILERIARRSKPFHSSLPSPNPKPRARVDDSVDTVHLGLKPHRQIPLQQTPPRCVSIFWTFPTEHKLKEAAHARVTTRGSISGTNTTLSRLPHNQLSLVFELSKLSGYPQDRRNPIHLLKTKCPGFVVVLASTYNTKDDKPDISAAAGSALLPKRSAIKYYLVTAPWGRAHCVQPLAWVVVVIRSDAALKKKAGRSQARFIKSRWSIQYKLDASTP
ncbi:hypothetical protein CCUS01_12594 [Colletotrichum cuscutae]|uniref:Uncharacterized protein n=1 Tax=Colletotrichum cuscutae TaxID=1209917 RepID=A0AAI9XEK8_9PEZI|nr:hypothetical protein CCUS01_12594 [Colletotrichum cuscutae]